MAWVDATNDLRRFYCRLDCQRRWLLSSLYFAHFRIHSKLLCAAAFALLTTTQFMASTSKLLRRPRPITFSWLPIRPVVDRVFRGWDLEQPPLRAFRKACLAYNFEVAFREFNALLSRDARFHEVDGMLLARSLRGFTKRLPLEDRTKYTSSAKEIFRLLQTGQVLPHPSIGFSLLGFLLESGQIEEGLQVWHWLSSQDERFTSVASYSAALRLYAQSKNGLPLCEKLFTNALRRYCPFFQNEFLASDVVASENTLVAVCKFIEPLLFDSIFRARLKHSNWRSGYLAVEKLLHLHVLGHNFYPEPIIEAILDFRTVHEAHSVFRLLTQLGYPVGVTASASLMREISWHISP